MALLGRRIRADTHAVHGAHVADDRLVNAGASRLEHAREFAADARREAVGFAFRPDKAELQPEAALPRQLPGGRGMGAEATGCWAVVTAWGRTSVWLDQPDTTGAGVTAAVAAGFGVGAGADGLAPGDWPKSLPKMFQPLPEDAPWRMNCFRWSRRRCRSDPIARAGRGNRTAVANACIGIRGRSLAQGFRAIALGEPPLIQSAWVKSWMASAGFCS